jgi:hypothetical protein
MVIINKKRPRLNKVDIKQVFQNILEPNNIMITMRIGQWDNFLEEGYFRQGAILIELDEFEQPIAAYKL